MNSYLTGIEASIREDLERGPQDPARLAIVEACRSEVMVWLNFCKRQVANQNAEAGENGEEPLILDPNLVVDLYLQMLEEGGSSNTLAPEFREKLKLYALVIVLQELVKGKCDIVLESLFPSIAQVANDDE